MRVYKYKLVKKQLITPSILHIVLAPQGDDVIQFEPGQYAAINFQSSRRPTLVRCFSLASAPANSQTIEFAMRVKGRFTKKLSGLSLDETVKVRGPFGNFLINNGEEELVFLAGGIGITPFLSMIRQASMATNKPKITLIYAVQNESEAAFADEILKILKEYENFTAGFIVSKGSFSSLPKDIVYQGRLSVDHLDKILNKNYQNKKFYICGPPGFMKGARKSLLSQSVDKSNIIIEAFSQGNKHQTERILSWPANVYALTSLGLVVGTFVIMAVDFIQSNPIQFGNKEATPNIYSQQQIDDSVSKIAPTISKTKVTKSTTPQSAPVANTGSNQVRPPNSSTSQSQTYQAPAPPASTPESNIQNPRTTVS